jgi:hypothetical protein
MTHPYKIQPDTAKWSRSVSQNWRPESVISNATTLLRREDKIASLGSCFASNLIPYLKRHGFHYVETERRTTDFAHAPPENFSYDLFSAAYGNVYTARQFRQLLDRALNRFRPQEDRWHVGSEVVDPFRPGLRFRARSDAEFDALTNYHLSRVKVVFETANVIIFTLGLTETWYSQVDGAVFPACPGTVAGTFDPNKHAYKNFGVNEIVADLDYICATLKEIRPDVRIILTVSPVPLVATATSDHVLVASTYSKSVLRVACSEILARQDLVTYFPAYELITGPQAPADFFELDRRNASAKGIDQVMTAFLAHCEVDPGSTNHDVVENSRPSSSQAIALSDLVSRIECEEAAADT